MSNDDRGTSTYERGTSTAPFVAQARPKKKTSTARQSGEARAAALVGELAPVFLKVFSYKAKKQRVPYRPKIGTRVPVKVVSESGWRAEMKEEAKRQAAALVPTYCKFAPERVLEEMMRLYDGKLPERLRTIDENTKLTPRETDFVSALALHFMQKRAEKEAENVHGIFSRSRRMIIIRETTVDTATVGHEMAHAYTDGGWVDFMRLLDARGKFESSNMFDEGMARRISSAVFDEWLLGRPAGTKKPSLGYNASYGRVQTRSYKTSESTAPSRRTSVVRSTTPTLTIPRSR
jgi:hypothetical protein